MLDANKVCIPYAKTNLFDLFVKKLYNAKFVAIKKAR